MRSFTQFLKHTFVPADPQHLPASSCELTAHDAMRICSGHVFDNRRPAVSSAPLRQVGVHRYRTEAQLREQLSQLDSVCYPASNLTVVLVLDYAIGANLRELVGRKHLAHRLVIVPQSGHWPGLDSYGDLALAARSIGWERIQVCRDFCDALEIAISAFSGDEQILVMLPADAAERRIM